MWSLYVASHIILLPNSPCSRTASIILQENGHMCRAKSILITAIQSQVLKKVLEPKKVVRLDVCHVFALPVAVLSSCGQGTSKHQLQRVYTGIYRHYTILYIYPVFLFLPLIIHMLQDLKTIRILYNLIFHTGTVTPESKSSQLFKTSSFSPI